MDKLVNIVKEHYTKTFEIHGPTAKGVDWGEDREVQFRYKKMMEVLNGDYERPPAIPSILDAGCGWGGLLDYCITNQIKVRYTGIDLVEEMIEYAKGRFSIGNFFTGNLLSFQLEQKFDYVVCNGMLSIRLNESIVSTENYVKELIMRMYELCNYGIAFNLTSNRVNFMVDNLFYSSPVEFLNFCLTEISPRVKLDHGYSCLNRKEGRLFEYTVYIFRD